MDVEPTVVAGNGTVIESGGVYLTFSCDHDEPYMVAKVVSVGGGPAEAVWDCQVNPDQALAPPSHLWVKLFYASHVEPPGVSAATGPFLILPVSVKMFFAWGPPKFPIRVGSEAVTAEELAARVADWQKHAASAEPTDPAHE